MAHKSLRAPIIVDLFEEVSHKATREEMRESGRRVVAMNAYGKELCRSLKHCFAEDFEKQMFRTVAVDRQTIETGNRLRERAVELKREESAHSRQLSRVHAKARRAGVPDALLSLDDLDSTEQSLNLMLGIEPATKRFGEEVQSE